MVSQHKQEVWNTFRDTNSIKNHWKKEMKFEEVAQIQDKCRQALRLWGYRDAKDELDLLQFDPVEPLPTILNSVMRVGSDTFGGPILQN